MTAYRGASLTGSVVDLAIAPGNNDEISHLLAWRACFGQSMAGFRGAG